jgi:hypothetical protein
MVVERGIMPRKPRKRPPPSRIRYENRNPVVSARVSLDLREALRKFQKEYGLSMADILKIGLDDPNKAAAKAYQEGYGDALGQSLSRVNGCSGCYQKLCDLIPEEI